MNGYFAIEDNVKYFVIPLISIVTRVFLVIPLFFCRPTIFIVIPAQAQNPESRIKNPYSRFRIKCGMTEWMMTL